MWLLRICLIIRSVNVCTKLMQQTRRCILNTVLIFRMHKIDATDRMMHCACIKKNKNKQTLMLQFKQNNAFCLQSPGPDTEVNLYIPHQFALSLFEDGIYARWGVSWLLDYYVPLTTQGHHGMNHTFTVTPHQGSKYKSPKHNKKEAHSSTCNTINSKRNPTKTSQCLAPLNTHISLIYN